MFILFDENRKSLDYSKFQLISDRGSECMVYKYENRVIKLFKEDYPFKHLTIAEINFLKTLKTKRILLPSGSIYDEDGQMVGYEMPFVEGVKDIQEASMENVLNEMRLIKEDVLLLTEHSVGLRDINISNSIFNGKLYLVDPGNYLVGDITPIKNQVYTLDLYPDEKFLLLTWNLKKIDQLFDAFLFSKNKNLDAYQYRLIVQFLEKEREIKGLNYNLEIFKQYFNLKLNVKESVEQFMKDNIVEDEEERKWYLSN